jgi:hypothetical protein
VNGKGAVVVKSAAMALDVTIGSRRYLIVSEPDAGGWRAQVLEALDAEGRSTQELGIHATGETRSAADNNALGKLQRFLRSRP